MFFVASTKLELAYQYIPFVAAVQMTVMASLRVQDQSPSDQILGETDGMQTQRAWSAVLDTYCF